jgi:hypothetical protein
LVFVLFDRWFLIGLRSTLSSLIFISGRSVFFADQFADLIVGGPVIRFARVFVLIALFSLCLGLSAQERKTNDRSSISLPTSKTLTIPTPGRIGSINSFPATITISPDGRYAALLNDGYGTQETMAMQSIAVLDLKTNQLADYPDKRFGEEVRQSYFLGLVFGSDGKHLYASVGSITDPLERSREIRGMELRFTASKMERLRRSDLSPLLRKRSRLGKKLR